MCQANIARVLEVNESNAVAEFNGKKTLLNIELLDNVKKGDFILFAGGVAIEKAEKPIK